jgi:hypothetical protein
MKTRTFFSIRTIAAVLAFAFASSGCGEKAAGGSEPAKTGDKPGAGTSTGKTPPAKTAAPAALAFKNLDKLGAKIEVPADVQTMDASGDAPGVSIFTPSGDLSLDVKVTTEVYASSIEGAKKEIEKDPNKFKKFTVENKTADGWHLEFELESMMDKTPLYGVQVRKKIGDKSLQCSRNVKTEAERAMISKACTSLTKI